MDLRVTPAGHRVVDAATGETRRVRIAVESNEGRGGTSPVVSLRQTAAALARGLGRFHDITSYPPGLGASTPEQRREVAEHLVNAHDVIVGCPDETLLDARDRLGLRVGFLFLLPGSMSRGGAHVSRVLRFMRTSDVFVVNSQADADTVRKYLDNARIRVLPWPVSEVTFHPIDDDAMSAARRRLGFRAEDRLVVYAGRLSLEKNVHTLIRLFSIVRHRIPEARLVLAGEAPNVPFLEMGVYPLAAPATLGRIVAALALHDAVRYLGPVGQDELRTLFNLADVAVNLTLHHSENFGLAQVEALLCGTPVVGTLWGGLKDTVVDNGTGFPVSTIVTDRGVKANWWEAAARIVQVLREGRNLRRREACVDFGRRFSQAAHDATIASIVAEGLAAVERSWEPVRASAFASEYWAECGPKADAAPPYQRGPRAFALYREMVGCYVGLSGLGIPIDAPLLEEHVLALAAPIRRQAEGLVAIDDPLFPFDVTVPADRQPVVQSLLDTMIERPVTTVGQLRASCAGPRAIWDEALTWLLRTGILLRSASGGLDPDGDAARSMSIPLFSIQHVDHHVDVIVKH